jgi:hypothetical protein
MTEHDLSVNQARCPHPDCVGVTAARFARAVRLFQTSDEGDFDTESCGLDCEACIEDTVLWLEDNDADLYAQRQNIDADIEAFRQEYPPLGFGQQPGAVGAALARTTWPRKTTLKGVQGFQLSGDQFSESYLLEQAAQIVGDLDRYAAIVAISFNYDEEGVTLAVTYQED